VEVGGSAGGARGAGRGGGVAWSGQGDWHGGGVLPADGLLEQPATASISAATTTKNNRLILLSRVPKTDLKFSKGATRLNPRAHCASEQGGATPLNPRAPRIGSAYAARPSRPDQPDQDQPNQSAASEECCHQVPAGLEHPLIGVA